MPFTKGDPNINTNGRPVGSVNSITASVRDELKNIHEGSDLTNTEVIVKSIIEKAKGGDREMLKLVWNYIDGLPKANVEVEIPTTLIGLIKRAHEDNESTSEQGDASISEKSEE